MPHSLSQNVLAMIGFAPGAFTSGTQNGTGVDLQQADSGPYRRACAVIQLNTGAATTGNFNLQDSPDNSTWTTVSGGTLGTAQAASLGKVYMIDIDTAKRQRYVRIQIIGTGTAGAAAAEFLLFEGTTLSPNQSQTPILV